jgi:hypothetical protein
MMTLMHRSLPGLASAAVLIGVASAGLLSRPLGPSLDCSACEVTAREIYAGYQARMDYDKFAGTELELIEVFEEACSRLGKYILAQEAFGSHLKVFADPQSKYDAQQVERAQFWSQKDQTRYQGVIFRLTQRCEEYTGLFEDEITQMVRDKAAEKELREFMCLNKTDYCQDSKLRPYKMRQKQLRRKWKLSKMRDELSKKWAGDLDTLTEDVAAGNGPKPDFPEQEFTSRD